MTLLILLLVKSLLVFALSGAALLCLRRASASARHLVCLLTLAALLALPLFSWALPGWQVAGLSSKDQLPISPMVAEKDPPAPNNGGAIRTGEEVAAISEGASRSAPTGSVPAPNPAPPLLGAGGKPFPWPLLLLSIYLLGIMLASLRPLLGLWGIAHLHRACAPVTDAPTLSIAADCAAALGLTRLSQTCRADVPVPMTWGGRRPVVALPLGSEGWPEDRLRLVLLHEMAHVKRRDWPCHRLADLTCAVYWFHPLVWLLARRLRAESEIACDDLVLSSGVAAPDYARHLLDIAQALSNTSNRSRAAIAMAQTSRIEGRITMILDTTRRRTTPRRFLTLAAVTGPAALVPLSMLQPTVRAQTAPAVAGAVQLVAIANVSTPPEAEWDQGGNVLQVPAFHPPAFQRIMSQKISAPPGQKALCVAFRIPAPLQQSARIVVNNSDTPLGSLMITFKNGSVNTESTANGLQIQLYGNPYTYTAAFPVSLKNANFLVGVASNAGTETIDCSKTAGKVHFQRPSGEVIFTLLPHSQGGAAFMVSDHFRRPSPLKSDNPLQVALHDDENYERSVYALDKSGKVLAKLLVTLHTQPDTPGVVAPDYRSIKTQQTGHLSSALLRRTASFRLVARPYQWTEFKDVALQPVKP